MCRLVPYYLIKVKGNVPLNGDRFVVKIRSDLNSETARLPLQLTFDTKNATLLTTYYDNGWCENPVIYKNMQITPASEFEIIILWEFEQYRIAVNGVHFCDFKHYVPYNIGKWIDIIGRVNITFFTIENMSKDGWYPIPAEEL